MLHFYVEDESTEVALIELVPRILAGRDFEYEVFAFQGKHNLLKRLPNRLQAYKHRPGSDWCVIVLVDRDQQDCVELKRSLDQMAADAGLRTRGTSPGPLQVINRIAIEELEAWFFGDVQALHAAYPRLDPDLGKKEAFRDPDAIKGGTWERLETLLKQDHPGGLEKIRAAHDIARHMQPANNRSRSFQVFQEALASLFN